MIRLGVTPGHGWADFFPIKNRSAQPEPGVTKQLAHTYCPETLPTPSSQSIQNPTQNPQKSYPKPTLFAMFKPIKQPNATKQQ
ncbi:MAG: hypothetical protein EBQ80_02380 [Proteobacteria bacterium]|nr:hypothetical protein [Pseudomonadota bacterium]